MTDIAEAYFELERAHRVIERHGGVRRARVDCAEIGGQPVLYETRVDKDRLYILRQVVLPGNLSGPMHRFVGVTRRWVDRIGEPQWRAENIISALEGKERMLRRLWNRASFCQGSGWLAHRIVVLLLEPLSEVAFHQGSNPGLTADAEFQNAALRIAQLLAAAECIAA